MNNVELFSPAQLWASERGIFGAEFRKNGEVTMPCPRCKTGRVIMHGCGWFFCMGWLCGFDGKSTKEFEDKLKGKS